MLHSKIILVMLGRWTLELVSDLISSLINLTLISSLLNLVRIRLHPFLEVLSKGSTSTMGLVIRHFTMLGFGLIRIFFRNISMFIAHVDLHAFYPTVIGLVTNLPFWFLDAICEIGMPDLFIK